MIIFAKADGTVIKTEPSPIYQGSSLKGSLYLVAPFPNSNGVTVQFQLPNGNVTKAYPMTPTGEINGVKLDNKDLSVWVWDVKNSMVTAIPGVVTATITVYNGEPNITYYDYATLTEINNIENPQINAYAYCRADGKVYKYDGNNWTESNIIISANDYVKATIISSFSIIKGTPSALPPSVPSPSEWDIIVNLYGEVASKVAYPLMTNFEYNPLTGESKKIYNNGSTQEETFPAINQNGFVEYNSFTKTTFTDSWSNSDKYEYAHSIAISNPTIATTDFDVAIFKVEEGSTNAEKMNPLIVIDKANSRVLVYSNEVYSGYALFFWKGSFVEQNYLPSIESAILEAEVATSQAEIATERANEISQTLESDYNDGKFGIPKGGTEGQVLTKTASGTAWEDAKGSYVYSPYSTSAYGIQCLFVFPKSLGITEATLVSAIVIFSNDESGYDQLYINTLEEPVNFCENGVWKDLVEVYVRHRDSYYSDWNTYQAVFSKTETNDTIKYSTTEYYFGSPSKVDFIVK